MNERVYDLDLCDDQQGGAGVIGLVTGKQDPLSVCSAAAGEWPHRRTTCIIIIVSRVSKEGATVIYTSEVKDFLCMSHYGVQAVTYRETAGLQQDRQNSDTETNSNTNSRITFSCLDFHALLIWRLF